MCGRYTLEVTDRLAKRFNLASVGQNIKSSYNIAPGQNLPTITSNGQVKLKIMNWGLVPFWSKDGKPAVINARAETINKKPMFKKLFKSKRCLVPASGFYEWKKTKQANNPYFISLKDNKYFAFAGLYDDWISPAGETKTTYTIITTVPNNKIKLIHHRMPVILFRDDEDKWLFDQDSDQLLSLLVPFPDSKMQIYPVSTRVNNPLNNDKKLLEKITKNLFD